MACLIAAPSSGSGKTLLTLAISAWLRRRGGSVQTFKTGPDYLDAGWLGRVSGRPCRNLDPVLCPDVWLLEAFRHWGGRAQHALVEGAMGLFDGIGAGEEGSSAQVARLLRLPVVLVVEASGQAGSAAALVRGFRDHGGADLPIAGVILNRVGSPRHAAVLRQAMEAIAMPVLGVVPRETSLQLPSRHLGLNAVQELPDLAERLEHWAGLMEEAIDWPALLPLLSPPPPGPDPFRNLDPPGAVDRPVSVAVAADAAFHFRYPEASELLQRQGAVLVPWRPSEDEPLPELSDAVVLPGGYPELHAGRLAGCRNALGSLRRAALAGLPIYAECGGLLLLGRELEDPGGTSHAMAGLLPFRARRGALSVGYRHLHPCRDGLLARRGEVLRGHELHRWQLQEAGGAGGDGDPPPDLGLWHSEGWGIPPRLEGWSTATIHASWTHLHWAGCPMIPSRLSRAARRFRAAAS
ncbi:cobyrinate a,c-diamide synthase [Synechococcus sp. RSCCF101]|uniref:cobyrinate a,c-diamide synthase n=1 Tax=Synechococcus sp. RSCCF101 TaxID=2511069 RepID=UPI0012482D9A|nr:cobyrinate a,c-diamide synthase [Synechococcus sp. RSCCF101]QEY31039.1 cobyrinate a,c-diamide synthase [Synechococcus sp. RSCCF101]